jgi:hypothetical protein
MMMNMEKIFRTSDRKLSSYLHAKNNAIIAVQQNPRRSNKAELFFKATDKLYRDIADYNANEPVPVLTFIESLEIIMDHIKEVIRGAGN